MKLFSGPSGGVGETNIADSVADIIFLRLNRTNLRLVMEIQSR